MSYRGHLTLYMLHVCMCSHFRTNRTGTDEKTYAHTNEENASTAHSQHTFYIRTTAAHYVRFTCSIFPGTFEGRWWRKSSRAQHPKNRTGGFSLSPYRRASFCIRLDGKRLDVCAKVPDIIMNVWENNCVLRRTRHGICECLVLFGVGVNCCFVLFG